MHDNHLLKYKGGYTHAYLKMQQPEYLMSFLHHISKPASPSAIRPIVDEDMDKASYVHQECDLV